MSEAAPDSAYVVRLPLFEGPLDLLLHLIEREELDITAISLAAVTDQFVAYLKGLSEVQPGVIADFLIVAARLILIKSRLLLPKPPEPSDDEDEEDPGEALVRRLRAYKRVKEAASWLRELDQRSLRSYVRVAPPPSLEARLMPGDASLDELILALRGLFDQVVELEPVDSMVSRRKVTVREKIDLIETLIRTGEPVPFGHLLDDAGSRIEIVVSIWAVLEMIKRGRLQAHQSELFGEIILVPPSNGK